MVGFEMFINKNLLWNVWECCETVELIAVGGFGELINCLY